VLREVDLRSGLTLHTYALCPPGRVKTLHPGVHGGILAIRSNPTHMDAIKQHNIQTIDLVRFAEQCLLEFSNAELSWVQPTP